MEYAKNIVACHSKRIVLINEIIQEAKNHDVDINVEMMKDKVFFEIAKGVIIAKNMEEPMTIKAIFTKDNRAHTQDKDNEILFKSEDTLDRLAVFLDSKKINIFKLKAEKLISDFGKEDLILKSFLTNKNIDSQNIKVKQTTKNKMR